MYCVFKCSILVSSKCNEHSILKSLQTIERIFQSIKTPYSWNTSIKKVIKGFLLQLQVLSRIPPFIYRDKTLYYIFDKMYTKYIGRIIWEMHVYVSYNTIRRFEITMENRPDTYTKCNILNINPYDLNSSKASYVAVYKHIAYNPMYEIYIKYNNAQSMANTKIIIPFRKNKMLVHYNIKNLILQETDHIEKLILWESQNTPDSNSNSVIVPFRFI